MSKKEIQEERMRGYFIDSAKKILRGEGAQAISVRTIAEDAGYSFATLYNYFKDLRELLLICINEFIDEINEFIKQENQEDLKAEGKIKKYSKSYLRYFIQYPGIFDIMFLEKMPEIRTSLKTAQKAYGLLNEELKQEWREAFGSSYEEVMNAHTEMVHGMLLFYLNRRIPDSYQEFMKRYDSNYATITGK